MSYHTLFATLVSIFALAGVGFMASVISTARRSRRQQEALMEVLWLLRDNEINAKGTNLQRHAQQLRIAAEDIYEEYKISAPFLSDDNPL